MCYTFLTHHQCHMGLLIGPCRKLDLITSTPKEFVLVIIFYYISHQIQMHLWIMEPRNSITSPRDIEILELKKKYYPLLSLVIYVCI